MRRDLLWLHGDRRGGFLAGHFLLRLNAIVISLVLLFLEHNSTVIILQCSYELEWILGSSGSEGRPCMDLLLSATFWLRS